MFLLFASLSLFSSSHIPSPKEAPFPEGLTSVDKESLTKTGNWIVSEDEVVSSDSASYLTYDFTGTKFWLLGSKGVEYGKMEVFVGIFNIDTVDTHSSEEQTKTLLYESSTFSNEKQTLKIGVNENGKKVGIYKFYYLNNGGKGMVDFESYTGNNVDVEASQKASFILKRTGGSTGEVTVLFETASLTGSDAAVEGVNYKKVSKVVTFGEGIIEQTVEVETMRTESMSKDLKFSVVIKDPTNGLILGFITSVQATIKKDQFISPTVNPSEKPTTTPYPTPYPNVEKVMYTEFSMFGGWYSGITGTYTTAENNYANYTFSKGNQFWIYGTKDPQHSLMEVYVDNVLIATVDTNGYRESSVLLYASPVLDVDGKHTVKMLNRGKDGKAIELRHLLIYSPTFPTIRPPITWDPAKPTRSPPPAPNPSQATSIDYSILDYFPKSNPNAWTYNSDGTGKVTNLTNSYFEYSFNGSRFWIYGNNNINKNNNDFGGKMEISVDGQIISTIDTAISSATTTSKLSTLSSKTALLAESPYSGGSTPSLLFGSNNLEYREHKIRVTFVGPEGKMLEICGLSLLESPAETNSGKPAEDEKGKDSIYNATTLAVVGVAFATVFVIAIIVVVALIYKRLNGNNGVKNMSLFDEK